MENSSVTPSEGSEFLGLGSKKVEQRIPSDHSVVVNPPLLTEDSSAQAESHDSWGFRDSRFHLEGRTVKMTGARYELSGKTLPNLFPWIQQTLGVKISSTQTQENHFPPHLSESRIHPEFVAALSSSWKAQQFSTDPLVRIRHGHGHTQDEMYAIKYGKMGRVPDWVVYPESEEQVAELVKLAVHYQVCLIPYGGGTNVTHSLQCPVSEVRMIISVDMSRMNRVEWVDAKNFTAHIQAGAVGRQIITQLKELGLTLGHEPDSVEFSTLGGWIATRASGMKKNRYGNIEDLVLDVTVVTADGELKRLQAHPRESLGMDVRDLLLGSEGTLGIITSATVRLSALPEVQKFASILFQNLQQGFDFLYELQRSGSLPASVRLMDNLQFQFSHALKPAKTGLAAKKSQLEKWWVTQVKGFAPEQLVALTLVYEGSSSEIAEQESRVETLRQKFGGMNAGAENGKRGYDLTFSIAYIRDFAMSYHVMAESFETSVSWSQALTVIDKVKAKAIELHQEHQLPGKPFISCRITQLYRTGVAIYFYYAFYAKGVSDPSDIYARCEHQLRNEILKAGGSLSHHHGIGKIRQSFLPSVLPDYESRLKTQIKQTMDPQNIFGVGNQFLGSHLQ